MLRNLTLSLCFLLGSSLFLSAQTLLVTEDFEDDGNGADYRANEYDDSGSDVWARSVNSNNGPNNNTEHSYSGYLGNTWWCGEDIDSPDNPLSSPNNKGFLALKTLDVSSYQNGTIEVRVYLAGNTGTIKRYRSNDYLQLKYAFDANIATGANTVGAVPSQANLVTGTYTTFGAFYGSGNSVATSSALIQDTDLDGDSEGSQGPADSLKNAFAEWTFSVSVGASDTKLSLLFEALTSGGSEEIGIDHIRVFGIAGSPSCTQTSDTIQAGTGTSASSGNTFTPYTNFFEDTRHQMLIRASEITADGGCAGDLVGLGMDLASAIAVNNNITISLKQTNDSIFSSFGFDNTGFTTVFSGSQTNVTGWNYYTFSAPFTWDGTSNIVVNWCINNTAFVGNSSARYTATSFTSHRYAYTDNTDGCVLSSFGSNTNRANMRLLYPVPVNAITPTNPSCNGGSDGQIAVTTSNGASPYTYAWSTSATTATITGLSAGTYTVTVVDAEGKNDIDVVTLTDPATLAPNLSDTDLSCFGANDGTITSTPSGGTPNYTYSWSNGATTQNLSSLLPGVYTLTITDANSCTASATATITTPTTLTNSTSVSSNVSCNGGSDGAATISVAGGTPSYTYLWSNGGTSATNSALAAGTHTVTVTDANGCTVVDNATVTEPTQLSSSIGSVSNVTTNGGSDGSATASGSGGTSPYTYAWSNGGTTAPITGLVAGTYSVTVTDNNGCTDSSSVSITQPLAFSVSTSSTNISCFGAGDGTAKANGSGGTTPYTYLWTTGATTDSLSGILPGIYTVVLTDNGGLTASATATITTPTTLTNSTSVSSNVSCNGGSDGAATISVAGGTPSYTYLWSNGGTAATNSALAAGTHTVTVTDANGCTVVDNATITEPTALAGSIGSSSNVTTNGGSDGSATAAGSGGTAPYTYAWSNAATTGGITGVGAGTYTVSITDNNGCGPVTDNVTITQPSALAVSITDSDITCFGANDGTAKANVTGGTTPYTYLWSNSATIDSLSGLLSGVYSVTVTDNGGTTASASATITTPSTLTNSTSVSSNVSCNGGSDGAATISVAGGTPTYTYLWSNGGTAATNSALAAGTHTVTVTDANGCTVVDNATVSEPTALTASVSSSANVTTNGGSDGSATAAGSGGTSPYTYAWSNSATTSTITGLAAGTYTVSITDNNGCGPVTDSVVITEPAPFGTNISSSTDVSCNSGTDGTAVVATVMGTSPFTYLWSNGQTAATATGLAAGTYTVTVTENTGLTSVSSAVITEPTAVAATVTGQVNVSCNGGSDGSVAVSSSGGTGAYTFAWSTGSTSSSISGLVAGTYTVTVTDTNGCTDVESTSITEPALLVAITVADSNVSCNGFSDGGATASATGGTSPYTYAWSNSATTASITGVAANTYSVTVTDNNGCTDSTIVTISEPLTLMASTVVDSNISCNAAADGGATASGTNGTMPYTYSWSNGATTASITGVVAGTYTVTLTDNNSCTTTASATIVQPAALSSTLSSVGASCNGFGNGSVSTSISGGTPPYSYLWSNGASTAMVSSLVAGTYTVTVSDNRGCTLTDQTTVTEPTVLVAASTGSTDITCTGANDGTAVAAASGGTSPYTYLWSNGGTTASQTNLAGGTYFFTITDTNGCVANNSVFIFEPNPVLANMTINSQVLCNGGSDGNISVSPAGGVGGYTQTWSNGDTTLQITGLVAGTYSVTVTDLNGCTGTNQVIITEPLVLAASASELSPVSCNGLADGAAMVSATGGSTPYTYAWSNGAVIASISGLVAGTYTATVTDNNGCTDTSSVVVSEPVVLALSVANSTDASCFGLLDGSATLTATGGMMPYAFNWSDGQFGASRTNLGSGTYTVTVVDGNLCSDTVSLTIGQPIALSTSIASITDVSCNGGADGQAVVAVTGGTTPYTYNWSGGQSADTANGLSTGVHTVTITDSNGCTITDVALILQPAALTSQESGTNVTCNGANDGSASVNVAGGTVPYTYLWTSGSTSDTAQTLLAGTYTVTITDTNGCVLTDTVTLTEPSAIVATATAATLGGGVNVSCLGGSNGSASASATGGSSLNYTYSWTGPNSYTGSGVNISGLEAGVYLLTVSNPSGCTDTASVTLVGPSVALSAAATPVVLGGGVNVSCTGGADGSINLTVAGGTAPFTYQWTGPGGYSSTIQNPTGLIAGTYDVVVTDAGGCTTSTSGTLTQPTQSILLALQPGIQVGGVNISCAGGTNGSIGSTVTSGGTMPFTYAWTGPNAFVAATQNIANLEAGTFTLVLTDTNGCTAIDSVTLVQPDSLILSASSPLLLNGFNTTCLGDADGSIDLNQTGGTPNFGYLWVGPNGYNSLQGSPTGVAAGNYNLTITDGNGCSSTLTHTVNGPPALALSTVVTMETFNGNDGTIDLSVSGGNPPYQYSWSNGKTTEDIDSLSGGTYSVVVTDDFGCSDSVDVIVGSAVGIDGSSVTYQWKVFPNPTKGFVVVQLDGAAGETLQLEVMDLKGSSLRQMQQSNLPANWQTELNLDDLPQGIYFIRLQTERKTLVERVVIH